MQSCADAVAFSQIPETYAQTIGYGFARTAAMSNLPLEMSSDQRRTLGDQALEFLDQFLINLPSAPVVGPVSDASVLETLRQPPAEVGGAMEDLLEVILSSNQVGVDTASGSHLGYIPNGGVFSGAVGEFLAAGLNRYTGGNNASTGAVAIEQGVIDWMIQLFSMGSRAAGVLLSGGSIANLTAVVTARSRFSRDSTDGDFRQGVVYVSVQAHHSITKAARLAGIAPDRVRTIDADASLRIDTAQLQATIDQDLRLGLRPMLVVASAGTTDSGTIDPLADVAGTAAKYGAWSHVDAAYGGFFQLTERGSKRLSGIDQFDSVTLDAHKSLFMPFGIGGLLVRDGDALVEAHAGSGSYLRDTVDIEGLPHFYSLGPELTRPFRGLPVWLGLHLHGVAAFRGELDRMLDLAERARTELDQIARVVVVGSPDLSVVVFRSVHGDVDTEVLLDHINKDGEVLLTSTQIHGRLIIRLAFLNPRTHDGDLDRVLELIETAPARTKDQPNGHWFHPNP